MVPITEKEFILLSEYINVNYGIFLKKEKKTLVVGRLQNVLGQAGFDNFTDYFDFLISDKSGEAVATFINKITTNHTFFMREADHFYFFRDTVLPFLKSNVRDKDFRIWCAGCSTGEEAYTIAMILDEFFGKEKVFWNKKILATDISEKVLQIARSGVYSNESIAPLPAQWKLNYLKKQDESTAVFNDKIKGEIIYRKFNLMDSVFPFKRKFHTIFCRNVMIYFNDQTKIELVNKFYDSLEIGGYLFIGHSESLHRESTKLKYIRPAVYRKE